MGLALSEHAQLTLLAAEVKTSDEEASPPGVVGRGPSSLHAQLVSLLRDPDRLLVELNWAFKHSPEERKPIVARAILLHTRDDLPIIAAPILVRPDRCHGDTDFGIFEEDPDSLEPAVVRFCLVRVAEELDDLAEDVYRKARET